ncbi:MAG TPA: dihydrofolate reductase family protein, partial [Gemmatimonadales bacterium]|nr:dihydrofolate reductase family protein [Gemmatimonadales bacterium]
VTTAREIPTYCVTSPLADAGRRRGLEAAGVHVLVPDSLAAGLEVLRAMGIGSLLVEGGGRLAAALLEADLVDRFYWIQSPLWLGDSGTQAVGGLPGRKVGSADRWHVVDRRALDEDTLLVVDRKSCLPAS